MQAFIILAGVAVLVVAGHLVRRAPKGQVMAAAAAFVIGLCATAALINVMTFKLGFVRATDYDEVVSDALVRVKSNPAPYVLFVGSSHTRNGLNDPLLTEELAKRGYPQQVINMSMYGASYQERGLQIRRFLKVAPRMPQVVFLEVSKMYDEEPAYAFRVAKFSDRAIVQMYPESVSAALRGFSVDYRDTLKHRIRDLGFVGIHTALNAFNVGVLPSARQTGVAKTTASYLPETKPKEAVPAAERSKNLAADGMPGAKETVWAREFRAKQEALLRSYGITRIAYYLPPVTHPDARAFVQEFCAARASKQVCIAPTDKVLLKALDQDLWYDHEHLMVPGTTIYNKWLAAQIDASGVLK